jgi:bifunctional DNA-binding transcriptional regulator/antitoxin component of YhaV-PrlF toxin-antitoxin module
MSGIYQVTMGDRGRLVVPAELRAHVGWGEGTPLLLVESSLGVAFLTQEQLKALVRSDLAGADLVGELLAERRRQAAAEEPVS